MNLKESTDIWFCAFLLYKNHEIKNYDVVGRGKVRCYFDIADDVWKDMKLQFNNSDLSKFKGLIEQIKDLAF